MTENTTKETISFDASGKKLGRLASDIAVALMGKNRADYAPNKVADVVVEVTNVDDLSVSESRLANKKYQTYSGYPGGLKERSMAQVVDKHGMAEILRRAVNGMLPKNKLQKLRLKNLNIK